MNDQPNYCTVGTFDRGSYSWTGSENMVLPGGKTFWEVHTPSGKRVWINPESVYLVLEEEPKDSS